MRNAALSLTGSIPKVAANVTPAPPADMHLLRPVAEITVPQVPPDGMTPPSQRAAEEDALLELKKLFQASVSGPCAQSSGLWQEVGTSRHAEDAVYRAMDGRASTSRRMLQTWVVWEEYAVAAGFDPGAPQLTQLLDFLYDARNGALANRRKQGTRSAKALLKGLKWFATRAQTAVLQEHVEKRAIKSFWKSSTPPERKEALLVPAAAVVDWETRVVQKETLLGEILFLGALLLLVWAGLRFGDLQRSNLSSLNSERGLIRGNSWRTKVTNEGQPWGANAFGLSGRPPDWGWAHVWFAAFATWRTTR